MFVLSLWKLNLLNSLGIEVVSPLRENAKQAGSVVRCENNSERKEPWCVD